MHNLFLFFRTLITALYLLIGVSYCVLFFSKRIRFLRIVHVITGIALVLHVIFLLAIGLEKGALPAQSLFEVMSVLAFLLAVITISIEMVTKQQSIGVFTFPFIFILQLISFFEAGIAPLFEGIDESVFRLPLFNFHTLSTVIGYSFFIYSMIIGLMYLRMFRQLKNKQFHLEYDNLPPLRLLERLNLVGLIVGFIFLTLGIVAGSLLTLRVWDTVPVRDPKILLSLLLWCIYLFGFIMKLFKKWGGRKMAYMSITGSIIIAFSAFVVNLLFPTFHRF
jgi:ABC-type transport system involved in cytochrome c biogenesis permease subunit